MSKKTKGSSAKKSNIKKAAKPVKKSPAKKTAVKKPVAKKKVIAKKTAPVKSSAKKVIAKKAAKPVKSASKPKVIIKKAVKKAIPEPKKVVAKKIIVKAQPKKIEKPVKPVITKNVEVKTASPTASAIKKEEKVTAAAAKKQAAEKPVNGEVLAITNTIPKPQVASISASKIASISSSITNPVKRVDSYSIKSEKEPGGKYEIEIVVRSSPEMLYEFLSTPSGLSEWFCDDVNIRNGIYTFIWEGQLQQARLLKTVDYHLVRFQWVDKVDGSYFEF